MTQATINGKNVSIATGSEKTCDERQLVFARNPGEKFLSGVDSLDRLACRCVIRRIVECGCEELAGNQITRRIIICKRTLDRCALTIPTRSHTSTKYRPRFAPLCSPDTPRNPITSARNFHFPSITSIQWPVTPRNEALVVSTDQPSAVAETIPGAFFFTASG